MILLSPRAGSCRRGYLCHAWTPHGTGHSDLRLVASMRSLFVLIGLASDRAYPRSRLRSRHLDPMIGFLEILQLWVPEGMRGLKISWSKRAGACVGFGNRALMMVTGRCALTTSTVHDNGPAGGAPASRSTRPFVSRYKWLLEPHNSD